MAREAVEFIQGADDVDPAVQRRRKQLSLRERGFGAAGGVQYGVSAFGQGGAQAAPDALGEQFGGGGVAGGDAGMGGDSGGGDAGSGGAI
jgi:hypothetical protein